MRTTTLPARATLALLAATALLGAASCGSSTTDAPRTTSAAPSTSSAPSDGGSDGTTASDGGSSTSSDKGGDGAPTTADRVPVVFVPTLNPSDLTTAGQAKVLGAVALSEALGNRLDGEITCAEDLTLSPGSETTCTAPGASAVGMPETWHAYAVDVVNPKGLDRGYAPAVLYTGEELTGDARKILDEGQVLTGLGLGSMFGSEPLSTKDIEEKTLQVLTSENAYAPLRSALGDGDSWSSVTCEDGFEFGTMQPVACTATTTTGARWQLLTLPGGFVDNDNGLLVALGAPHDI